MKKKSKQHKKKDFDRSFDKGEQEIDFAEGLLNEGLSKTVKLPPIAIPCWLAAEIEALSKMQANSKASVVRQLLIKAIKQKETAD